MGRWKETCFPAWSVITWVTFASSLSFSKYMFPHKERGDETRN